MLIGYSLSFVKHSFLEILDAHAKNLRYNSPGDIRIKLRPIEAYYFLEI